jgi:hypothetical protein
VVRYPGLKVLGGLDEGVGGATRFVIIQVCLQLYADFYSQFKQSTQLAFLKFAQS